MVFEMKIKFHMTIDEMAILKYKKLYLLFVGYFEKKSHIGKVQEPTDAAL